MTLPGPKVAPLALVRQKVLLATRTLEVRYAALATRERAWVVFTVLALGVAVWDFAINQPMTAERGMQAVELERLQNDVRAQNALVATLRRDGGRAEVQALRAAVAQRQAELRIVEKHLQSRMDGLVSADRAERLLADVLSHYPGLELVSAEVLAAEPLTGAPQPATGVSPTPTNASTLYKHGLRLELSGSYLDSLAYLRELEQLPWTLSWDRVEYQVSTFPNGRLVIELHTVSDRKEWVGA